MTKKLEKAIEILKKRIRTLGARFSQMSPRDADFYTVGEELSAMKVILEYVEAKEILG